MNFLRQSTASQVRVLGPFVDDTDGKTAETGLTIANTDIKLMINGAASVNKNSGGGTHRINGMYSVTFNATDTATVGELAVSVVVAGALPVWAKFFVLEEVVFDALFAASSAGPLTTLGTNAPANWINAAAIAASAMNAKGDWATTGAAMTLTSGERSTLAAAIEAAMINEGDATALLEAIADKIAAENPSLGDLTLSAIASAVWANATRTLSANPGLDAAGFRAALGLASANLDTQLAGIPVAVDTRLSDTHGDGSWDAAVVELSEEALDSIRTEISETIGSIRSQVLGLVIAGGGQITITQGNDYLSRSGNSILLLVERAGVDFAGATAEFAFGRVEGDPIETVTANIEDAAVGSCNVRVQLRKSQTSHPSGQYKYDCRIYRPEEGQDDEVITVLDGEFVIRPAAGAVALA